MRIAVSTIVLFSVLSDLNNPYRVSKVVDVTIALQCQVKDSKLFLTECSKVCRFTNSQYRFSCTNNKDFLVSRRFRVCDVPSNFDRVYWQYIQIFDQNSLHTINATDLMQAADIARLMRVCHEVSLRLLASSSYIALRKSKKPLQEILRKSNWMQHDTFRLAVRLLVVELAASLVDKTSWQSTCVKHVDNLQ